MNIFYKHCGLNLTKISQYNRSKITTIFFFPWIGGTLTKLVYFEPTDLNDIKVTNGQRRNKIDLKTLTNIRRYLITNKAYGDTGRRDDHLEMSGVHVGGRQGTLHFIRFPTSQV